MEGIAPGDENPPCSLLSMLKGLPTPTPKFYPPSGALEPHPTERLGTTMPIRCWCPLASGHVRRKTPLLKQQVIKKVKCPGKDTVEGSVQNAQLGGSQQTLAKCSRKASGPLPEPSAGGRSLSKEGQGCGSRAKRGNDTFALLQHTTVAMASPLSSRRLMLSADAVSKMSFHPLGFLSVTLHMAGNWLFFHESFQAQLRDHFLALFAQLRG